MILAQGTRLGPYEIGAQIGVGGMGEVYRAHDSRLQRDVAIKTSTARFNERFEREARAIAALNHPNICTLHDIGPDYLVMELVDGAAPKGPLPIDEVLRIATQVAAALQAAHDKGIVHRDLKPANVRITPTGLVKVLDFGLAKILRDSTPDSPTLAATQAGAVMGTPAYMAPEQAQGLDVDKRADVWAFGVLVYELLTGRGPFHGDSQQAILTAVLTGEPEWTRVPPRLQRLLRACLAQDPRERLSSIGDWRLLLDNATPVPMVSRRASMLPWAVGVVGLGLGAFGLTRLAPAAETPRVIRFDVPIPGGVAAETISVLSPDGRHLAISAPEDGQIQLRVRQLDTLETRLLPGAEGARFQFWKPDGTTIGFFADGKLKTIPLAGGPPTILTNVDATVLGASWSQLGTIVLSQGRELYTVNDKGGTPVLLYSGPGIPNEPTFLPDGRHFLYRDAGLFAGNLDGSPPIKIAPFAAKGVYSQGYLLSRRQGRLVAQPFDPGTLTLSGTAIPVTNESVSLAAIVESFSVAGSVLAYQAEGLEQLVWRDRSGAVTEKVGAPQRWPNFRLSPNHNSIAFDILFEGAFDVGVYDVRRATIERLTSHDAADLVPVFSPDGKQLAFASMRNGRFNPYVTSAPGKERLIADIGTTGGFPMDWSPDGRSLLYWGDEDLWIVPTDGGKPHKYTDSKYDERTAAFSPDGRWIAYASNESGRYELYLQHFPDDGSKRVQVSNRGGLNPAWRRDGKELFYVAADGRLMVVPITFNSTNVELGRAESLFPVASSIFLRRYELSPDGQRILVTTPASTGGPAITVLLNWRQVIEK